MIIFRVGSLVDADDKIAAGFDDICIDTYKSAIGQKGAFKLVRLLAERPRCVRKLQ